MDAVKTNLVSTLHIDKHGTKLYYLPDGKTLHRVDGPALEYADGRKVWWLNGKRHRVDGPAVERTNGDKVWWANGKVHRVDGPAVEYSNGNEEYFLNGVSYPFEEWQVARKLLWML